MYKHTLTLLFVAFLTACGSIDTGNVGVRTTFTGEILADEVLQGFYTSFTSNVTPYSTKEITVDLFDMRPKAADNLSMHDLDIEVYYVPKQSSVAELKIKYANRDGYDEKSGVWYPAYELVRSNARNVAYEEVAKHNSLDVHKERDAIAKAIHEGVQIALDESDPGIFSITKVIIRNAATDPSIEESIKIAVAKNKELEAKRIELDIAQKQVEINQTLDLSLTPAVLRQRELDVQLAAIEKGSNVTLVLGNGVTPMIPVK